MIPHSTDNNDPRSRPRDATLLSIFFNYLMTVVELLLAYGNTYGKRKCPSITVRMYLFTVLEGPLNSMLNLSIGDKAFIKTGSTESLENLGFISDFFILDKIR